MAKFLKMLNNTVSKKQDKERKAKKPGKRVSADGNTYYEYRSNRADKNKKKRL